MAFRFPAKNQQQQQQGAMAEGGGGRPARVPSVFRRLLVRVTPAERLAVPGGDGKEVVVVRDGKDGEAEVGSVALDRMVLSFMEDSAVTERPARGRCSNCFNGQDASDDEEEDFDFLPSSSSSAPNAAAGDALELLKGLVQCASAAERNLLADASRIGERCGKVGGTGARRKTKSEVRRAVADGLRALGYDAAVCRSRWDKSPTRPAGEHEYIDALLVVTNAAEADGPTTTTSTMSTRVVVEVDFRAEFEVARPTKAYRAALQALPPLFVGAPDRVGRVVALVAEAARQSMRKRGLHVPPWRKPEYMRAKWLAPHQRHDDDTTVPPSLPAPVSTEFELRFDDKVATNAAEGREEEITAPPSVSPSRPVQLEESTQAKPKMLTGLASVL